MGAATYYLAVVYIYLSATSNFSLSSFSEIGVELPYPSPMISNYVSVLQFKKSLSFVKLAVNL